MSPLATNSSDTIIEISPEALATLITMRDDDPDKERLGLRLEVLVEPGQEFRYDLSFDIVTQAALSDQVRTIEGLKIIVPQASIEHLQGATLDYNEQQGLVIRNPNRPPAPNIEGLVADDELAAAVETVISAEINPSLASHGGFVTFVGHDGEGTVYLTMGGGCHGCAMSKMTMLEGVQTAIVAQVEGVERVRDLTDHASGANPYYT